MKLSTKSRYALRMVLDIAKNSDGKTFIPLRDIAGRQEVSVKYLEQIVTALTRSGLLVSSRGSQGGYALTRPPDEYTAGEIIRAIEGNLAPVSCLKVTPNHCQRADSCDTLKLWVGLHDTINTYLDSVTLADLL